LITGVTMSSTDQSEPKLSCLTTVLKTCRASFRGLSQILVFLATPRPIGSVNLLPLSASQSPGERRWEIFKRLCTVADARGNLVPDAWFAALAIESGCEWITLDRDYARFQDLRWRLPA